jgi:hypothetical protein
MLAHRFCQKSINLFGFGIYKYRNTNCGETGTKFGRWKIQADVACEVCNAGTTACNHRLLIAPVMRIPAPLVFYPIGCHGSNIRNESVSSWMEAYSMRSRPP